MDNLKTGSPYHLPNSQVLNAFGNAAVAVRIAVTTDVSAFDALQDYHYWHGVVSARMGTRKYPPIVEGSVIQLKTQKKPLTIARFCYEGTDLREGDRWSVCFQNDEHRYPWKEISEMIAETTPA